MREELVLEKNLKNSTNQEAETTFKRLTDLQVKNT